MHKQWQQYHKIPTLITKDRDVTQSDALCKSQNIAPTGILLLKACNISLINSYEAIYVANLLLNANCSLDNILFLVIR
jgi:hypothetical protein